MQYCWEDVRAWSEVVCSPVSKGRLTWQDEAKVQNLRLRLSQVVRQPAVNEPSSDIYDMDPEVAMAKPGPPCRQYNFSACSFPADHTGNGFRQLHLLYAVLAFSFHVYMCHGHYQPLSQHQSG